MDEKRKSKRLELNSKLLVKRLDGKIAEEVDIQIEDVSKNGLGFYCDKILDIGAVYEGFLTIWTKESIHAFMEIVRIEKKGNTFLYGAFFVGMPMMDAARIEIYQTVEENT